MATYRELLLQKQALDREIERAQAGERAEVVGKIRTMMAEYGITASELEDRRRGPKSRPPVEPRYRDPQTGATWSGRGKAPRWIAGQDRAQFLIGRQAV